MERGVPIASPLTIWITLRRLSLVTLMEQTCLKLRMKFVSEKLGQVTTYALPSNAQIVRVKTSVESH
jgi:hypothetical protein